MEKIQVICPTCSKIGYIYVSLNEDDVKGNPRGILAINVYPKQVCSHALVAYVDKNLELRDCLTVDFQVELPQLETDVMKDIEVPDINLIDVDLIKMNFNALPLAVAIHGCVSKQKVLILVDEEFLHDHLLNFFNYIFRDNFNIDISVKVSKHYESDKKKFKDFLVMDSEKILKVKDKHVKNKEFKIERVIVSSFLAENEPKPSLIVLKNEIQKLHMLAKELSQEIVDMTTNPNHTKVDSKDIISHLSKICNVKISLPYLIFLIEIIEQYFEVAVPMTWKFFLLR
jgi:hypothetical protein